MASHGKIRRSLGALSGFLFRDLTQEEFSRLFGTQAPEALRFHLRDFEAEGRARGGFSGFLARAGFLAREILAQLSPARRLLFVLAFVLAVASMFTRGNLPLYAFAILAFLLLLELTEKLLARDEIEIARNVQRSLFPQSDPQLEGWSVASRNIPANDVGGDYFDYVRRSRTGALGLALGDVAGKGMGAALLVANLQATLRALLETDALVTGRGTPGTEPPSPRLEDLFSLLNRALGSVAQSNRFASLVYGELDPRSGRFDYVNAGQNPPLVVRADGHIELLPPGGMILGVLPEARYRPGSVVLGTGDALVLYCDGVTERFDAEGEEYGEERLVRLLETNRGRAAPLLRDVILADVERHGGGTRPHDDVTVVVVTRDRAGSAPA